MKKKFQNNKRDKKKMEVMDVVFLLDRSGSMSGVEDDTIGGYNSYIKAQIDKSIKITTILFDDQYEMIEKRNDIKNVSLLDNKKYFVRGCTALFDAIGKTINYIDVNNPEKVIFIITTDGLENASKEYNKEKIRNLINKHNNWEFMFIGADIDSYSEGIEIGIKKRNISNYSKNKKGIKNLFGAIEKASCTLYEENTIYDNWKSDLDFFIDNNILK